MSDPIPARANLAWLRKTAKQQLQTMRAQGPQGEALRGAVCPRQYGFSNWRSLKAHIDQLRQVNFAATPALAGEEIAMFLRAVGDGRLAELRVSLTAERRFVNAIGPHPYWGGRPQALHISIETRRRDMFDMLLDAGADINGSNDQYEHWSPLMLTFHWSGPEMRQILIDHGARVGLVEAMLFEDDVMVERLLRAGRSGLPANEPNGGSLLAFARTPFAIDRLLELGVSPDKKDRWNTSPMEAMSRLGPRGLPLVRHLVSRGAKAEPQDTRVLATRRP
jgi:hypothetical protein